MAARHLNSYTHAMLMATLSTLSPCSISLLTQSISTLSQHHRCRLANLLSSPILFSLSLIRLQYLSLREKSTLVARYLHSILLVLLHHLPGNFTTAEPWWCMKQRDLDTTLLMLLISEIHQHDQKFLSLPSSQWRTRLLEYLSDSILSMSQLGGFTNTEILIEYVENVDMCWNCVRSMGCRGRSEVTASAKAVVSMPSVDGSGGECVICREEMWKGREVCRMPCGHLFHWGCILKWLRNTNTCPCCRHSLPTNNVHREIERIMEEFAKVGSGGSTDGECGGGNAHNIA